MKRQLQGIAILLCSILFSVTFRNGWMGLFHRRYYHTVATPVYDYRHCRCNSYIFSEQEIKKFLFVKLEGCKEGSRPLPTSRHE